MRRDFLHTTVSTANTEESRYESPTKPTSQRTNGHGDSPRAFSDQGPGPAFSKHANEHTGQCAPAKATRKILNHRVTETAIAHKQNGEKRPNP